MKNTKTLRITASALLIVLIGYFYGSELSKNWTSLQTFKLAFTIPYLVISLLLFLLSYLLETFIWQVCINKYLGRRELNFNQSFAVVNSSGLLKYLPGRIWTYTAQLLWLKKYNISKSLVLYVNLICIAGSVMVSLYLGLIYLAAYTNLMSTTALVLSSVALITFNIAYVAWNSSLINFLITAMSRIFKKEVQLLNSSKSLIILIQCVYILSWALMGLGGYFLAKGIGLNVPLNRLFALLASMSLSWMAGYAAVISPGGFGVREGTMLFMLKGVANMQTALIFPILSRLMYLISEAILGLAAFSFGIKYNVFSSDKNAADR